jgi:hypothetical protein
MSSSNRQPAKSRAPAKSLDAIALLKADHRQVEKWFAEFEKTSSQSKKQRLSDEICGALKIHTQIEEEIFYPAFLSATKDKNMHHEAIVEHDGAKKLIAEIQAMQAGEDFFDAKISVLSEMIKHHVKEEEQPGGMFAEARKSSMDLKLLGARLQSRKEELQGSEQSRKRAA